MRTQKINTSFISYSDAELVAKGTYIVTSMTDNTNFPSPVPTLAEVQAALGIYAEAFNAAAGLGRNNIAVKNQARAALELLLAQLGRYVMYVANGDLAILVSSGYTVSKEPQPRHLINPGALLLENGITSGTVKGTIDRGNATSFLFEISDILPADSTAWTKFPSNNCQYVFTNLTPGKQYWARVAAIGFRNQVAYSEVATKFVQ
jgi:hypothetical protein